MGRINSTEEFEERLRKTGGSQDKYEWRELFYDWREFVKTPEHHEEAMQYMKENRPYIDIMYMSCGFFEEGDDADY